MGQTSQTVKGKTTSIGKNNRGARNKKSVDSNTLFWQRLIENAAKQSERERYEMTDRGRVLKNVKEKFSAWNEIREFEKTTAYEQRLQQSSKFVFDSICYDAIKDRKGENWSLDLEKYNADKEYFPITCNFNEIRATIYVSVPIAEAPQFQENFNRGFQTAERLRRFGKFVYVQNMICPTSILVNRKPYWIWRGGNREGYYGEINDDFFIDADTAKVTYKDAKPLVVKFNDLGIKNKYLANYVYVFKKEEPVKPIMMSIDGNSELVDTDKIYEQVEEMPSFPGGSNALSSFIAANLKYPVVAQENGIQGRVVVKFVVDKDGRITDVEITRSVDPSFDKEAMRIVKAMPKWKPGKLKGNCVRVKYTIPIVFGLS